MVKNGGSRHGRQRWLCRGCGKTCGKKDHRRVGVSHNAVMNWVLAAVEGKALAVARPEEVEWVEADELWTYVGRKNGLLALAGC